MLSLLLPVRNEYALIGEALQALPKHPDQAGKLINELAKYDPVKDFVGGYPMGGGKVTKPGGHYIEIRPLQRGIKNDTARYLKECIKCDNDKFKGLPIPRWVDEMANRPVPVPVPPPPSLVDRILTGIPVSSEALDTAGKVSLGIGVTAAAAASAGTLGPALGPLLVRGGGLALLAP